MAEAKDFTVLMPISGRGLRFAQQGINVPKPLIEVIGIPLFNWALSSLPDMPIDSIVVVEHEDTPIFLSPLAPKPEQISENVFTITGGTGKKMTIVRETGERGGAAITVRKALINLPPDLIAPGKPLVVTNCDHMFGDRDVNNKYGWQDVQSGKIAGLISTFPLKQALSYGAAKWSYAITGGDGNVVEVIEKPTSLPSESWHPTIGVYYFRDAPLLLDAIDAMVVAGSKVNGEFYLAPAYNHISPEPGFVATELYHHMRGLGTPEDIDRFVCEFWRSANTLPEEALQLTK